MRKRKVVLYVMLSMLLLLRLLLLLLLSPNGRNPKTTAAKPYHHHVRTHIRTHRPQNINHINSNIVRLWVGAHARDGLGVRGTVECYVRVGHAFNVFAGAIVYALFSLGPEGSVGGWGGCVGKCCTE